MKQLRLIEFGDSCVSAEALADILLCYWTSKDMDRPCFQKSIDWDAADIAFEVLCDLIDQVDNQELDT